MQYSPAIVTLQGAGQKTLLWPDCYYGRTQLVPTNSCGYIMYDFDLNFREFLNQKVVKRTNLKMPLKTTYRNK